MDIKLAKLLCDRSDDFTLHENYSGRGMFGVKTVGVSYKSTAELIRVILTNAHYFVDDEGYPLFEHEDLAIDNMGCDYIVY
jgi:hypothetical protein